MWPWGHLAVGYLCYSAGTRLTDRRISTPAVVAVALGTQFPDLVDKPLAWTLAVLPNGRSLAHSLLVAGVVAVVLLGVARRVEVRAERASLGADGGRAIRHGRPGARHVTAAFLLGYASHILTDAVHPLVQGEFASLAFLGWPILPPVRYDGPKSFVGHFASIEPTPFFLIQIALVGLAIVVWYVDGCPGVAALQRILRR